MSHVAYHKNIEKHVQTGKRIIWLSVWVSDLEYWRNLKHNKLDNFFQAHMGTKTTSKVMSLVGETYQPRLSTVNSMKLVWTLILAQFNR